MRRPSREINIFSLSALDLFASALGAFILLTVILFPYYLKNHEIVSKMTQLQQELESTQSQLTECQSQLEQSQRQTQECQSQQAQSQQQLEKCQAEVTTCREQLAQTFLAVIIKWQTQQDIDLHIIDPGGHEFYFSKNNQSRNDFPGVEAELSVDMTTGPGIEIWENPQARPGTYKVYANLYARKGDSNNPIIKSSVYFRDGSVKFNEKRLTQEKTKVLLGSIVVKPDGSVQIIG
ncbi:hypothetical protein [Candidatus Venteria ishoeyi]|uniref:DUF2135 domain-containing protein n=1 Tax=Candidatus Venteria ishoeyi TaxID=1899563 RepID=A0A1H6FFB7_9GAMM|nr:hypothetical protein [Candidatus Venteria ishoeyi]SEH07866.1 Uncharacterised protein [Candidatus Venteria ishoeyi]